MTYKKNLSAEQRLREMIQELPVDYMPQVSPPSEAPDSVRWGRYRGQYSVWYVYRSATGYRLFHVSSWKDEDSASAAVVQAARDYPAADLLFLDRDQIKELLEGAE